MNPDKPPRTRPGFRWEYRTGCQCKSCPWKGNCRGEDWPHWREVKVTEVFGTMWRPIETAPKDGTHILAYDPEGIHGPVFAVVNWYVHRGETFKETETEGLYRKEMYEHEWWDGASYTPFRATHWQPLPAAPLPNGESEAGA